MKDWTLLIFMAGDNDLDPEGERDLMQLKSVDPGDRIQLAVQFDRAESGRQTRRYRLRHGSSLISDVVSNLGETNTGDPAVLQDFLLWGIREYPARHVLAVIWNHGGGVDDTDPFADRPPAGLRRGGRPGWTASPRGPVRPFHFSKSLLPGAGGARRKIAVDDGAGDFLDNLELKQVLANVRSARGRPVDILGLDACLMSLVEVAWQLRASVAFTVGSQDNEPGAGWPYDTILKRLAERPSLTPAELAQTVVACYLAHYPASTPVTQSACTVANLPTVIKAVDALAAELLAGVPGRRFAETVFTARQRVLQFANPDYVDLDHLCVCLAESVADPGVRKACAWVQTALARAVVAGGSNAESLKNARGLSLYFPQASRTPLYSKLDFAADCRWADFLKTFIPSLKAP